MTTQIIERKNGSLLFVIPIKGEQLGSNRHILMQDQMMSAGLLQKGDSVIFIETGMVFHPQKSTNLIELICRWLKKPVPEATSLR